MTLIIENDRYPEIEAFLNSEPPNVKLPENRLTKYQVSIIGREDTYHGNMSLFQIACLYGKTSHIESLKLNTQEMKDSMWQREFKNPMGKRLNIITLSAINGHTGLIKNLMTCYTPEERQNISRESYYEIIEQAANNGHTSTIQYIESLLRPEEKKEAVKWSSYRAIRNAAINGHISTVEYLERHLTPEEINALIADDDYSLIAFIAENGHTETIKHLETHLSLEEKKDAVKSDRYFAIKQAAMNDHTKTIQYLETHLSPEEKKEAVQTRDYQVYQLTAKQGHTEMIQHLETHLSPEEKKEAVKANHYAPYRLAAEQGHTETIQHLETHLSPEEKKEAVKADHYAPYRLAAKYDHTETIQYLETHLTLEERKEQIKVNSYSLIDKVNERRDKSVLKHFLSIDVGLEYAERNVYRFEGTVLPYISDRLRETRIQSKQFLTKNPDGVFDVPAEEARCLFYMARHLIRRNDRESLNNLIFLLRIPSVKNLAHQRLNDGCENELLKLAFSENNLTAAEWLLSIPQVNALAAENNYYGHESRKKEPPPPETPGISHSNFTLFKESVPKNEANLPTPPTHQPETPKT